MQPVNRSSFLRFGIAVLTIAIFTACGTLNFNNIQLTPTITSIPSSTNTTVPTNTLAPTNTILLPLPTPGTTITEEGASADYHKTGISDITGFIKLCPDKDPAYEIIRKRFSILKDGSPAGVIPCSDPFTEMPIGSFTNELIALQVMRIAYYMDTGTPDYLPWTSKNLFTWMTDKVAGVNITTTPGQLYCCDVIDGKKYIVQSTQSDEQREFKRSWEGLSSTLDFFAHEIRHLDGDFNHITGCVSFPDANGPAGCDQSYDPGNLSPYGVQYWLNYAWLTGFLDIGMSCSPENARNYMQWHLNNLNLQFRDRFVSNIPPLASFPSEPFGGPCYAK